MCVCVRVCVSLIIYLSQVSIANSVAGAETL